MSRMGGRGLRFRTGGLVGGREAGRRWNRAAGRRRLAFESLEARHLLSFTIGTNFTGSSYNQSFFIPPDTMGAVGPNHIVELINGRYAAYTKSGSFVESSSLNSFWIGAGVSPANFAFDPRIVYDPGSGRWFAVSVDNAGAANNFLVAVSATDDPTGTWTGFVVDTDSNNTHWADFPMMGLNQDVLVVQANMFPVSAGGVDVTTLILPKSDLTAAVPTVANRTLLQETSSTNNPGFGAQPVVDLDNGSLPLKMLSSWNKPAGSLKTSSIIGTAFAPVLTTAGGFITVTARGTPPTIDQPGPKVNLDAGDNRFGSNVVQQHIAGRLNPSLWGVHGVNISGRAALEWYEIDAVTNALLQSGTISDASLAFNYPSISVNDAGDVVIGFSGGNPSTYMSTYVAVGQTAGGVTTFDPIAQTKAGVADYQRLDGIGRNRWGDYSATVLDPTNSSHFWTFQEFASGTDAWSIQVTEIIIGGAAGIDLLGTSFGVNPAGLYFAGGQTDASFTVRNQGGVASGAFDVKFYLSDDAVIDPGSDILLTLDSSDPNYDALEPAAYHVSGGLGSGSNHSNTITLAVPSSDPFATDNDYYIGMVADADDDVAETDEANNRNRGEGLDREDVDYLSVFSNPNAIDIPSNGTSGASDPYPSTIDVSGLSGTVTDVNVLLNDYSHTWPDDVDILLVGPAGQKLLLISDAGGSLDITGVDLVMDDAAGSGLPDASLLTSGTFKPTDFESGDVFPAPAPGGPYATTLAAFDGTDPNGTWSLYVNDDAGSDVGSFSGGWGLQITTSDTTPPIVTIDSLSTTDTTPPLTGTVDDPTATIEVDVDVQTGLAAINNGDGTWTLPDDTLAALIPGTYDVVVRATDAALNVGTDGTIDELTILSGGDSYEPNDSFAGAYDLGTLGNFSDTGLSIHETNNDDYFSFTAVANGQADIILFFSHAAGDIDLEVYDSGQMLIDHSESTSDSELVSIPVEQGQVYYVVVYGYNGATNPAYQMDIIFSHSGDYNGDRLTDAADNVLWRTMLGQAVAPFTGADGSGDGIVGPEDHDLWAANFGHVQAGAGSGAGTSSKVVSPSALAPAVPVVAAPQAAQSAGGGEASDDGFVAGEKLLGIPIASGERALGAVRGARISSGTRVEASDRDAALAAWVASRPSGEQPGGDGVSDTLVTHENGEPDGSLVNALDAAFETLSADAA